MHTIMQRITRGWNFMRIIYLVLGIWVILQSIQMRQWVGVLLGVWFAAMGLFALGCAAGTCSINSPVSKKQGNNLITNETDPVKTGYEEIKGA